MVDLDFLKKLAQIACDEAISNGAECADVGANWGSSLSVDIELNAIKSCDASKGGGISVRAIRAGGTGWSSTDTLTPEGAAEAGKNAAKLACMAAPDPDFIALPNPAGTYPEVPGLVDPAMARIDIKTLIRYALENVDGAVAACPEAVVEGGFSVSRDASALVNSNGICLGRESSSIGGSTVVIVRHGDDVGSFYDYDVARVLTDFSPDGIGARAAKQAMKFLGARTVETGRMPVILGPLASSSIFRGLVGNADAENVQRGRSFMMGKVGQKVASDVVTITDNPLIPRGLGSRAYDYEGMPCKPLTVVENGVLMSYLYGTYTAGKAKTVTTGHGTRGGGAAASNVIPKLGSMTGDEIIKSTRSGIYINMGGLNPDATTGDVSSVVDFGFKIENGELAYPVKTAMIGGRFLDITASIDAVSSDYREEPGMILPTVLIQDVLVAGGG